MPIVEITHAPVHAVQQAPRQGEGEHDVYPDTTTLPVGQGVPRGTVPQAPVEVLQHTRTLDVHGKGTHPWPGKYWFGGTVHCDGGLVKHAPVAALQQAPVAVLQATCEQSSCRLNTPGDGHAVAPETMKQPPVDGLQHAPALGGRQASGVQPPEVTVPPMSRVHTFASVKWHVPFGQQQPTPWAGQDPEVVQLPPARNVPPSCPHTAPLLTKHVLTPVVLVAQHDPVVVLDGGQGSGEQGTPGKNGPPIFA